MDIFEIVIIASSILSIIIIAWLIIAMWTSDVDG